MAETTNPKQRLSEFYSVISDDLDRCVEFWLKNSPDNEYGGYLHCLDAEGKVYDTTKQTWKISRQVWMYARLYLEVPRFNLPNVLEAAKSGAEFLMKYIKKEGSEKCYVFLTREGKPLKSQRSIFSELFYAIAMAEMYRATKDDVYKKEALTMMKKVIHWVKVDSSDLGDKPLPPVPTSSLAVPMMLLLAVDVIEAMDPAHGDSFSDLADWCVDQIKKHVKEDKSAVLDTVREDGEELEGSQGRLTIPGLVIEAGWFLLQRALKTKDEDLQKLAVETFIMKTYEIGWDKEYEGLFYYVDLEGKPPMQLEWDMKVSWAHSEALIGFLMAYQTTGDEIYLEKFAQVFDYIYSHFADTHYGEWFGYLNREGNVKINCKGSLWKGFFHIPRALMMCEKMLHQLLETK